MTDLSGLYTGMEEARSRDTRRQNEMRNSRRQILTFLEANPDGLHVFTRQALEHAAEQLWEDILRLDRRWD